MDVSTATPVLGELGIFELSLDRVRTVKYDEKTQSEGINLLTFKINNYNVSLVLFVVLFQRILMNLYNSISFRQIQNLVVERWTHC